MRGGKGGSGAARAVQRYLTQWPEDRRRRLQAIRAAVLQAHPGIRECADRGALAYETDAARVRMASRKRHIGVYFQKRMLLDGLRLRHPELACGSFSVRIRDDQYLPLYELQQASLCAFSAVAASEEAPRKRSTRTTSART